MGWLVFAIGLIPGVYLWMTALDGGFANPVEALIRSHGDWALRFLWLTLTVTPAALLFGWYRLYLVRRALGLLSFTYAAVHVGIYAVLDRELIAAEIWADVIKRPFITIGVLTFLLLVPLAATSFAAAQRALGRRWKQLHRLIYPAAILAVVHYTMMVKADTLEPLIYAGILAVLFALRFRRSASA